MKYKKFKELTEEEQNHLKTAYLLGLKIEASLIGKCEWVPIKKPKWSGYLFYRIKEYET